MKRDLFRKFRLATTRQLYEKVGILTEKVGILTKIVGKVRKIVGKRVFDLAS